MAQKYQIQALPKQAISGTVHSAAFSLDQAWWCTAQVVTDSAFGPFVATTDLEVSNDFQFDAASGQTPNPANWNSGTAGAVSIAANGSVLLKLTAGVVARWGRVTITYTSGAANVTANVFPTGGV